MKVLPLFHDADEKTIANPDRLGECRRALGTREQLNKSSLSALLPIIPLSQYRNIDDLGWMNAGKS
jgi:hypothetical protein